jgi:hypothetical protein
MGPSTTGSLPIVVGSLVLMVLCLSDFRSRLVRRPTILYWISLTLFLLINLLLYLVLVRLFLNLPDELIGTGLGPATPLIAPIVVSFLYFGVGAATFTLGRLKFNFYETLIGAFGRLFEFVVDTSEVRKTIFDRADYDHLKKGLDDLHDEAATHGWDELTDEWKDIQNDSELVEKHIHDLESLRVELEAGTSVEARRRLAERLEKRAGYLRENLLRRLKNHLYRFVLANAKSEADVAHMMEGVPGGWDPRPREFPTVHFGHALVAGFVFGFIIGLVFLGAGLDGMNTYTPWIAAVSVSVFTLIFFFSMKTAEFAWAVLIGGAAGFLGQIIWEVLAMLASSRLEAGVLPALLARTLVGVLYGAATGLIMFLYRTTLRERIGRPALRGLTVAGLGAVAFSFISLAIPLLLPGVVIPPLLMAIIGALLSVCLAHACRLLRHSQEDIDVPA